MKQWRLIALLIFTTFAASGHTDPEGEVHPVVQINEDHFRVGFRINSYAPGKGWDEHYLKRVFVRDYDLEGKTLNERKEITDEADSRDFYLDRSQFDAPYTLPNGWHIWRTFLLHDKRCAVLAYKVSSNFHTQEKEPKTFVWDARLNLFLIDTQSNEIVAEHHLGLYQAVAYDFPAVSNIVMSEDALYVVWNKSNGWTSREEMISAYSPIDPFADPISSDLEPAMTPKKLVTIESHIAPTLTLSRYDLGTDELVSQELPFPSHSNTHIGIGMIGNSLCIAYHGLSEALTVEVIKPLDQVHGRSPRESLL